MQVRPMTEGDLPFVVALHERYFPQGFFAKLGPGFLAEYYRGFLATPTAVALVAEDDGRPLGYLAGLLHPQAHRRHLLRQRGVRLAVRGGLALARRPRLAVYFLRTRAGLYARKLLRARAQPATAVTARPDPDSAASPEPDLAVLSHVAVLPDQQGRGVGSRLVDEFERRAQHAGCRRAQLVTSSARAGAYYRHRGWHVRNEHETHDGVRVTTYEHWIVAH